MVMVNTSGATMIYRGPFESQRLKFLLDGAHRAWGSSRFVWLAPSNVSSMAKESVKRNLLARWEGLSSYEVIDGGLRYLSRVVRHLRRSTSINEPVIAVGFTALPYLRGLKSHGPMVWCINGIPEELLMHVDTKQNRGRVRATWAAARLGRRPDLVVTVSPQMSALVRRRLGPLDAFDAPTCVNTEVFKVREASDASKLVYLGTGAPWQNLDQLAAIWRALHGRNPNLRFQVISKDPRARVLTDGFPSNVVEYHTGGSPEQVAELLRYTAAGFIIRRPHVVNEVSFPTKFGEYVASGIPVLTTDIGWQIAKVVRDTGCGTVVRWNNDPDTMAEELGSVLGCPVQAASFREGCRKAVELLDRRRWIVALGSRLAAMT